jgi:signal transduction histidine kinase
LLCVPLTVVGFVRFSLCFLEVERPWLDRAALLVSAMALLGLVQPRLFFAGEPVHHRISWLGIDHVEPGVSPFGIAIFAGLLVLCLYLIPLYASRLSSLEEDSRLLFVPLCVWLSACANDMAVAAGLYEAPYLTSFGYSTFILVFSAVLVRRFVNSMEEVERTAENLENIVDARTEDLHQKDLLLAHNDRMATIGTLAAGVAHEINNPVAYVSSNLNYLQELYGKPDERAEADEIFAECREGLRRVGVIVSELLTFARPNDSPPQFIDLGEVVKGMLPIIRHEAKGRAEIITEFAELPPVWGDARFLGQACLNLALNGIQSIPKGRKSGDRLVLSTRCEGDHAVLCVRDTGCGIPEDVLPRIFDPFFTTKPPGEGTGLGLAITHQLIARHSGTIAVESSERGTTFLVSLPISEPENAGGSQRPTT